ncbi:tyrosine--tRNA ligase [Patescibacteria group bacterium]|nr:tyrosine--tRNA ligase [Patescibacteria group bacterium]MBU4367392.1 tyrosine--tRNA ligase [Patescibacteria group bacterium]MBU4461713.1 tyrosine--tRNA ligase [Patescibacteria group bacterium]MCG2700096.1 tyrosine--tRNA ligase [Candidatus Parcubacteria bacterium]
MNALEVLKTRGFIQQCSDENGLKDLFSNSAVTYYVGFDPTAESFHVGSLIPIMAMAHLQRLGHKPIAIIGGGTGLIGDPSGKSEMRKLLSREDIANNMAKLSQQFNRYLLLDGEKGLLIDNADWIVGLNYIEFLRDIGRYFKVNEMIKNEGYRLRLEREEGLSFIEFNYQLLQAYDFLVLFDRYGCMLQMGGDDQWGNILAGVDLVKKMRKQVVFALTFPLITTARGQKMGKTEAGAIWLDATKTSPYDLYQYWINCDDRDVIRFLKMFTFLPMEEIEKMAELQGAELRKAKEILAFEATRLCHGENEAVKAQQTARAAFSKEKEDSTGLPTTTVSKSRIAAGILAVDLLVEIGLVPSKSAARRLIEQGGAYVNDEKITAIDAVVNESSFQSGVCIVRHGKKQHHRVVVE